MDDAEADVLAFMTFPTEHHAKIHLTNPLERVNKQIKRRTNVECKALEDDGLQGHWTANRGGKASLGSGPGGSARFDRRAVTEVCRGLDGKSTIRIKFLQIEVCNIELEFRR